MPARGGLARLSNPAPKAVAGASSPNGGQQNLSPLAKKVPNIKKTNVASVDMRLQIERDALITVIDTLSKDYSLLEKTYGFLKRESAKQSREQTTEGIDAPPFPAAYTYLAKLPSYWYCSWIVRASKGYCTKTIYENIELKDPENLRRAFDFFTCTNSGHAWPAAALDKVVLERMMDRRAKDVGDRIKGWFQVALRQDSSIDWTKGGPYTIEWAPSTDRAISVKHISGERAFIPDHIVIDKSFQLDFGWCDVRAQVSKPPSVIKLIDLFCDLRRPPHNQLLSKKADELVRIADSFAREVADMRLEAKPGFETAKNILSDAKQRQRDVILKKARESARARKEQKKQQRSQGLGGE